MKSALLVIDAQASFLYRPYFDAGELARFLGVVQPLIDRAKAARLPVLQIFHVENDSPSNPFSFASGHVKPLPDLRLDATEVFHKSVHSALFGSNSAGQSLDYWLRKHGIKHLIVTGIRTEQCCETTARHASDVGYKVSFALDATSTFAMMAESGRTYSPADIRERTGLVLHKRFADVLSAEAVPL